MEHVETVIVGGGPAGSTCGRQLVRHGRDVLILDRAPFPRPKLCAGWITEKALADLELTRRSYPRSILRLAMRTHIAGVPFAWPGLPTAGDNFSIRRIEFDDWLLKRSGAPVVKHAVKSIRREGELFIIDDRYSCRFLVGAGGTMCPVRRNLFPGRRIKSRQLATLELEFDYPARDERCHLFFHYHGLKGYGWYVPKGGGFVNIGIGGKSSYFRKSGTRIREHLRSFLDDLVRRGLLDGSTASQMRFGGHPYYLFSYKGEIRRRNCFLIGDSAGLASADLGEGIGPAVESGIMAAREIMGEGRYSRDGITRYSLAGLAGLVMKQVTGRHHARRPAA